MSSFGLGRVGVGALEQAGDDALALQQLDAHVDAGLDLLEQAVLPRRRPVGPPEHLVLDATELDGEERGATSGRCPPGTSRSSRPLAALAGCVRRCASAARR